MMSAQVIGEKNGTAFVGLQYMLDSWEKIEAGKDTRKGHSVRIELPHLIRRKEVPFLHEQYNTGRSTGNP